MKLRELLSVVDYANPQSYGGSVEMANNTDENSFEISLPNTPFYVGDVAITIMADTGEILDENNSNAANQFTIQVTDSSGKSWFNQPISLFNFKKYSKNHNWRGFYMPRLMKYTVEIKSVQFPATPVAGLFPVKIDVTFLGFNATEKMDTTPTV